MFDVNVDLSGDKALNHALKKAPNALLRHIGRGLHRGALEIEREARANAPKAETTLTQSIGLLQKSALFYVIGPKVNYGAVVEYRTNAGGVAPVQSILDWIRVKGISPDKPQDSDEDLAFIISRSIAKKGTEAQPYMQPAAMSKRDRVFDLVQQGVSNGLREVGLI